MQDFMGLSSFLGSSKMSWGYLVEVPVAIDLLGEKWGIYFLVSSFAVDAGELGLFSCTQRSPTMSILSISSASTLDQRHQLVSTTKKMKKDSHDYDVVTSHFFAYVGTEVGRVDEEIAMFHHKLKQIEDGVTFVGRTTKQARSIGKKIQVTAEQEI
ncbi:hypothetical protein ACSQ67_001153 [Phaseolus vulgaris]